ncbi:MAG TPA: nuclear transport factor 2 family protein [Polyangiaceae bacterium]|nr:nuclear transport factor 2 family protein [Polyangiaceae bacterium]
MSESKNIETVNQIYAAFGRGDVAEIFTHIDRDVDWEFGATEHGIPWLTNGKGLDAVRGFFEALRGLEFHDFRVISVMANGPWVVALVSLECTVKSTGRRLREVCEAHVWRFDADGRVIAMRHAADTWHHARALGLA